MVITGGLGYIGSLLLERIQPPGRRHVLVIDNRSAHSYGFSPIPVPIDLIEDDIRTVALDPLISGADVVVHLAAVTDVAESLTPVDLVNDVNVEGTRRVAEACVRTGARLLFISTTSVYGSRNKLVAEDCPAVEIRPQSPYAASKWRGERVLAAFGKYGLRYAIVRFGSVFGPSINMRLHTAINRFCWQASLGQPIAVWRTALHQHRPYLHIDDAVCAIQFVVSQDLFDNLVYNVVTVNPTVHDVLQRIRRYVPALSVQFVDSPIMNELSYAVAVDRIRRRGFTPQGELAAGIRDTLDVLRRDRSATA